MKGMGKSLDLGEGWSSQSLRRMPRGHDQSRQPYVAMPGEIGPTLTSDSEKGSFGKSLFLNGLCSRDSRRFSDSREPQSFTIGRIGPFFRDFGNLGSKRV